MIAKLQFSFRKSAWLFALLIITSALPASAQDEDEVRFQEWLFNFAYSDDLNGYIVSPNKSENQWEDNSPFELFVPSIRLRDGKPVVALSGFGSLKQLAQIIFPEDCHVKCICDNCFEYCTFLGGPITLPESVETIGHFAFYGCTALQGVNLSSNLKSIGREAFKDCVQLQSITLPKSLKEIREYAFQDCTGLEEVVFEDGVNFYTNSAYCFYNNVFWGCSNLSKVKLPDNTPGNFYIPVGTFGYCSNIKSIVFPENTRRIEQMAFYRSGLESLDLTTIESDVLYLQGYYTFAACENLTTVKAKGKVVFDGLYIFQECTALETVTFTGAGDDYTVMNPDIFKRCYNLRSAEFYHLKGNGQSNDMDSVFTDCKSLVSVTSILPPEISKIGYSCFDGCTSLKTLSLPDKEFAVNETAFRNCTALESFDFTNVTSIGTQAFTGCSALTSISINSIPTMENENAFDEWHFTNTEIAVPDEKYQTFLADEFWGKFTHYKHPSLLGFTLDEATGTYSVKKSEYALDEDFTGMLEIPAQYNSCDVVAIEANAFAPGTDQPALTALTGVTIPEGIASIGANAFGGCTGITKVINKVTAPLSGDNCPDDAFDNAIYANSTLYVPFGSLDAYKSSAPWSKFTETKQGFGERTLTAPTASLEQSAFDKPFDLTLTNPNEVGTIYFYIVNEGDGASDVRTVETYSAPIKISNTCKVVAYISDGTTCCEPVSLDYTRTKHPVSNNTELISMEADMLYEVNVNLEGVKAIGGVLYARTSETSAAQSKPREGHTGFDSYEDGYKLNQYEQRDWVAIAGLASEYEGKQIGTGFVASYDGTKLVPVTAMPEPGSDVTIDLNTFGVANVFYGNYENTAGLGMTGGYQPFFVKAKVNEVANFLGSVKLNADGKYELWGSGVCGKFNEKGLEIEANGTELAASATYKQIEGVLVADAAANGRVKLIAMSVTDTPTGVESLEANGKAAIYGTEGAVVVAGADGKVMIFDAMGRMVKSVSAEGAATVEMPAGYYIVRTAGTAKAVIVK